MSELNMAELLSLEGLPGLEGEELPVYKPLVLEEVDSNPTNRKPDIEDDYSLVRRNLHFQSQMLMDMAKIALENAKNAESPRHVEVFATLMGQMTATNKELLRVHKDMKDITDEKVITGQVAQQQADTFLCSPEDMIEEEQEEKDSE